jgi:hypothetical protein
MTAEEAKTKMCPFIQSGVERGLEYSPMVGRVSVMNIRCICGDCMAWKWSYEHIPLTEEEQNKYKDRIISPASYTRLSTTEGYCARIGQ